MTVYRNCRGTQTNTTLSRDRGGNLVDRREPLTVNAGGILVKHNFRRLRVHVDFSISPVKQFSQLDRLHTTHVVCHSDLGVLSTVGNGNQTRRGNSRRGRLSNVLDLTIHTRRRQLHLNIGLTVHTLRISLNTLSNH